MPLPSLVQQPGPKDASPRVGSKAWLETTLDKWDKGGRTFRYRVLETFVSTCSPGLQEQKGWSNERAFGGDGNGIQGLARGSRFTPAHVLEKEYGGAASLFLTRVVAWLRTSYLLHQPISVMLDCVAPFLTCATTGGLHFMDQFLDLGGVVVVLDILTMPRAAPADKLRALRILEMVADAGGEYKRRICESPGEPIDLIVDYLTESAGEDDGLLGRSGSEAAGSGPSSPGLGSPGRGFGSPRSARVSQGSAAALEPSSPGSHGKEPPMLHAQRLLTLLGTDNPAHAERLLTKVCELMRVPNAYVQRAAAKLTRELLMANHPWVPTMGADDEGANGGEGGGGDKEDGGRERTASGAEEATVAEATGAPRNLVFAVEAVIPLTHSPNFHVTVEATLLLDELAKYPGAADAIREFREAHGYPQEAEEKL